jgi:hypothetical protein
MFFQDEVLHQYQAPPPLAFGSTADFPIRKSGGMHVRK